MVFPDQTGGFFVFRDPLATWPGPALAEAEAWAARVDGWVAGGLEYAEAGLEGPGCWGVFAGPEAATRHELELWADPGPVVVGALSSPVDRQAYGRAFEVVRGALEAGVSYQVNLTFPVEGGAVSGPPWAWPSALRLWLELTAHQGREASFAVLGSPEAPGPVLVSASPELFFHRQGDEVEARPMKGTAARSPDPVLDARAAHDLARSPKTQAENLMVTDMLRNDLGRLARAGGVTVPRLFEVEAYPTVWQMTSTVRAQLPPGVSWTALVEALFPCASITGAPKVRTQAVIAEAEGHPRGWYTGTLGWFRGASPVGGPARGRFAVLIRTLVFDRGDSGRFRLGVGGGVVWDSTAEGEWDEAWAKTRFLGPVARRFGLTEAVLWSADEGFWLLDEHRQRLGAACRDFGGTLAPGVLEAALEAEVGRLRARGLGGPFKLRVVVDPAFDLTVEGAPVESLPEVLTLALARGPFGPETLLWRRYKTTERRLYTEARVEGVDQTLHFNEAGEATESTSMTLVVDRGGRLVTPPLEAGLLAGTFRARLLAEGRVVEAPVPLDSLGPDTLLWLVNSVRGWKPARWSPILNSNPEEPPE